MSNKRRIRNNSYHKYYANTSEAFELESTPYVEPRRRVKKPLRTRKNIKFKYIGKTKSHISVLSAITIILVFIYATSMVSGFAFIFSKQNNIEILQTELKKLEESNIAAKAQISGSYNLDEIKEVATNKLGMSPPKPHQIKHITVPKESYAIQYDVNETKKEYQSIILKFVSLLGNNEG